MNENDRITLGLLIAGFLSLVISIPATYSRAKKLVREGKCVKNLPLKMGAAISLPIVSLPVLLSNIFWPWKIVIIIVAALGGASNIIGVDAAQMGLRQLLGLPTIDENTGMIVKEKDDKDKDEKEY